MLSNWIPPLAHTFICFFQSILKSDRTGDHHLQSLHTCPNHWCLCCALLQLSPNPLPTPLPGQFTPQTQLILHIEARMFLKHCQVTVLPNGPTSSHHSWNEIAIPKQGNTKLHDLACIYLCDPSPTRPLMAPHSWNTECLWSWLGIRTLGLSAYGAQLCAEVSVLVTQLSPLHLICHIIYLSFSL